MQTPQNVQSSRLPMKYTEKYSYSSPSFYKSNLEIFAPIHIFKTSLEICSHEESEATQDTQAVYGSPTPSNFSFCIL